MTSTAPKDNSDADSAALPSEGAVNNNSSASQNNGSSGPDAQAPGAVATVTTPVHPHGSQATSSPVPFTLFQGGAGISNYVVPMTNITGAPHTIHGVPPTPATTFTQPSSSSGLSSGSDIGASFAQAQALKIQEAKVKLNNLADPALAAKTADLIDEQCQKERATYNDLHRNIARSTLTHWMTVNFIDLVHSELVSLGVTDGVGNTKVLLEFLRRSGNLLDATNNLQVQNAFRITLDGEDGINKLRNERSAVVARFNLSSVMLKCTNQAKLEEALSGESADSGFHLSKQLCNLILEKCPQFIKSHLENSFFQGHPERIRWFPLCEYINSPGFRHWCSVHDRDNNIVVQSSPPANHDNRSHKRGRFGNRRDAERQGQSQRPPFQPRGQDSNPKCSTCHLNHPQGQPCPGRKPPPGGGGGAGGGSGQQSQPQASSSTTFNRPPTPTNSSSRGRGSGRGGGRGGGSGRGKRRSTNANDDSIDDEDESQSGSIAVASLATPSLGIDKLIDEVVREAQMLSKGWPYPVRIVATTLLLVLAAAVTSVPGIALHLLRVPPPPLITSTEFNEIATPLQRFDMLENNYKYLSSAVELGQLRFTTLDGGVVLQPVLLDTGSSGNLISAPQVAHLRKLGVNIVEAQPLPTDYLIADSGKLRLSERVAILASVVFGGRVGQSLRILAHVHPGADGDFLPIVIGCPTLAAAGICLNWVDTTSGKMASHNPTIAPIPDNLVCVSITNHGNSGNVLQEIAERTLEDGRLPTQMERDAIRTYIETKQREADDAAVNKLIGDIRVNENLTPEYQELFAELINEYRDVFTSGYTSEPCTIMPSPDRLKDGANPAIPAFRNPHSFNAASKIWQFLLTLWNSNIIEYVADRVLPGACHVFTTGPDKSRLVVDTSSHKVNVERQNDQPEEVSKMIHLIVEDKNNLFVEYDCSKVFYQVEQNPETPETIRRMCFKNFTFAFKRLIMGGVTSMHHLNEVLKKAFSGILGHSRYADDGRIGAKGESPLYERSKEFLHRCRLYKIMLNPIKFKIAVSITYRCGYKIDNNGFIPDPRSAEMIKAMTKPLNGEELTRSIGAMRWMSIAIPDFARIAKPLQDLLTSIAAKANSQSSSALRRFPLAEHGWTSTHDKAWEDLKLALINIIRLSHRDRKKQLILVTDACNTGWAALICQCAKDKMNLPADQRPYEPLMCLGGNFSGSELNWNTIEKEAYAIKRAIDREWHLFDDGTELLILTDNKNLESVYDPDGDYIQSKPIPSRDRLLRWCATLRSLNYKIQHISGEVNAFADVLSRISNIPVDPIRDPELDEHSIEPGRPLSERLVRSIEGRNGPVQGVAFVTADLAFDTTFSPDWVQPSIRDIHAIAGNNGTKDPSFLQLTIDLNANWDDDQLVWVTPGDSPKIIIPAASPQDDIRSKLIIMAHCQSGGHRGVQATLDMLRALVFWPHMDEDVASFVRNCPVCIACTQSMPARPYGQPITPVARNEILSCDFLHLTETASGHKMVLVLMDKLSNFMMLFPAKSEDAATVVEGIKAWISLFGLFDTLMTDQGTAFNNQVIESLADYLQVQHHMTSARVHWLTANTNALTECLWISSARSC